MARLRKPGQPGPKLSPEARQMLINRIVAGDSNQEILDYLQDAGYPADLTRATLARYRGLPEVTAAVQDINVEHSQSALAVRSRRIKVLNNLVNLLQMRLGLVDNAPSRGNLKEKIETGASSPLEDDDSEDAGEAAQSVASQLTIREICELSKALVTAMTALNALLEGNSSATAAPTGLLAGLGAFDGKTPISQVETKPSVRALFNDILAQAMREEEEDRQALRAKATESNGGS